MSWKPIAVRPNLSAMFSGIISDLGEVRAIGKGGDTKLVIGTSYDLADAAIGASIACSGACLTVVEKGAGWFAAMVSAETMAHTTLASWRIGSRVNLELDVLARYVARLVQAGEPGRR